MPTIKLLKRAELEVFDACEWYEKQQKGLSAKFRFQLKTSLNYIGKTPMLYAQKYDTDLYFAPVQVFPFIIVYWYDEQLDTVFVTSVFHTRRNPEKFEDK